MGVVEEAGVVADNGGVGDGFVGVLLCGLVAAHVIS